MKKRQLKRARTGKKKGAARPNFIIQAKAAETAGAAARKEAFIDCLGNFIFFATEAGEAWMLDHRRNCALRLAENGVATDYRIRESAERFQIEWRERYRIEGDLFIATRNGREQTFRGYPVDAITGFIELLKQKKTGPADPGQFPQTD